jgi:transcription initiation factor TFIIIB Brf1 subunit/transcription initiation factor TFIIB
MVCPKCKTVEMKQNEHGAYVCPKCKGVFMPESMFGITKKPT